ncbi:MAG: DNA repair protein RadA, partial [Firmicutes bacterium]|nr:DNA repair protein RadA [Bacillota bacterium]
MRQRKQFVCRECGLQSPRWLGRCPECGAWHTLEERTLSPAPAAAAAAEGEKIVAVTALEPEGEGRFATGFGELDRVLGGGLVPGSLILVGGDPGIGKSTLALQVAARLGCGAGRVLYVSGEESSGQLALRARRLGIAAPGLYLLCTPRWQRVAEAVEELDPFFVVVDSVQSIYREEIGAAPGTVTQVRECTAQLLRLAKGKGICVLLIGHVTKDGVLAGPRLLEHMVDAVLYFEGERHQSYRLIRGVKNRFGSTNEIGIFEMGAAGLSEVANPSSLFLRQGAAEPVPGAVVTATMEGNRPLLVEIQALVCPTGFGTPR